MRLNREASREAAKEQYTYSVAAGVTLASLFSGALVDGSNDSMASLFTGMLQDWKMNAKEFLLPGVGGIVPMLIS
jgi:hypothetical protein